MLNWCKWCECKWCKWFKCKWHNHVDVNNVNHGYVANDVGITKLINDKTDLKQSVHRHHIPNSHRLDNDVVKNAIDEIGTMQRLA